MPACGLPVTVPLGGGVRQVIGCPRLAEPGEDHCRAHLDEERYQRRRFEEQMAKASRHHGQIVVHGKGVRCLCGQFVPDGEEHPWGVPAREEDG